MKIYNETKTEIIENPDLEKGYLILDRIISKTIPAVEAVVEQSHYDYKFYENGGKEKFKVIDVPAVEAKPETYEYEDIQVFIPYTATELNKRQTDALIEKLKKTDYIAAKISEAQLIFQMTQDDTKLKELYGEYGYMIAQRETWREEIRKLEKELITLTATIE